MQTRGELELDDGTRIAYRVTGTSGPWLLLCNGITTSHDFWDGAVRRWPHRRVIQWDYPGHGASSPAYNLQSAELPSLADTCVGVLDRLGVETTSVAGFSMGSQVALLAALESPSRFDAVASVLGPAGRVFDTALWGLGGRTAARLLELAKGPALRAAQTLLNLATRTPAVYRAGRLMRLYGPETSKADIRRVTAHMRSLHAPSVRAMALSAGALDLHPRLPDLVPPLLILAGERDAFAPATTVGRVMKRDAPKAELVVLREGTHGSLFGHADVIAEEIDRFLDEQRLSGAV